MKRMTTQPDRHNTHFYLPFAQYASLYHITLLAYNTLIIFYKAVCINFCTESTFSTIICTFISCVVHYLASHFPNCILFYLISAKKKPVCTFQFHAQVQQPVAILSSNYLFYFNEYATSVIPITTNVI